MKGERSVLVCDLPDNGELLWSSWQMIISQVWPSLTRQMMMVRLLFYTTTDGRPMWYSRHVMVSKAPQTITRYDLEICRYLLLDSLSGFIATINMKQYRCVIRSEAVSPIKQLTGYWLPQNTEKEAKQGDMHQRSWLCIAGYDAKFTYQRYLKCVQDNFLPAFPSHVIKSLFVKMSRLICPLHLC